MTDKAAQRVKIEFQHDHRVDSASHGRSSSGDSQDISTRKRKRSPDSDSSTSRGSIDPLQNAAGRIPGPELCVALPHMRYPRPLYRGWKSEFEEFSEARALRYLKGEWFDANHIQALEQDEAYVTLSQFCIYRQHKKVNVDSNAELTDSMASLYDTMAPLSDLFTRRGDNCLLFSGLLHAGSKRCYVRDIPFDILAIDGYGVDVCSVSDQMYIQSHLSKRLRVWYHLSLDAAPEYHRFHKEFLWLADFGKHFVCYLLAHDQVRLVHFKQHFYDWLHKLHRNNPIFSSWLARYGRVDFRRMIVNHSFYLYRESTNPGVDPHGRNWKHFIWKEVHPELLGAIKKQRDLLNAPTIVTPYIFQCFKDFYFGAQLEPRTVDMSVQAAREAKWQKYLSMSISRAEHSSGSSAMARISHPITRQVKIGDIIGLGRDESGGWKDKALVWYAYIHDIEKDKSGRYFLHILWLYRPHDTICSTMSYPYTNELFLSDHCNCICRKDDRVYAEDVTEFPSVKFSSSPISENRGYFIRQTYITQDAANQFVELKKEHLTCEHRENSPSSQHQYRMGDTFLVDLRGRRSLEPVELVHIDAEDIHVRRLLRRGRDCGMPSKDNELVYTDRTLRLRRSKIVRKCYVRFYTRNEVEGDGVPAPYKYNGIGDCWIVTAMFKDGNLTDIQRPFPPSMLEGFDPTLKSFNHMPQLRTLDLFCGARFFGRGIEDSGVARAKWSVDLDKTAIHTARANSRDPDAESFFWGSAVHYMALAMEGKFSPYIASIGGVHLIIAGSPCQGFSILQSDKTSDRSRKNASMIALTLAFIDLYRPRYAILENVFGMTKPLGEKRDQQVFAQVICALVGMGYQTQAFHMDAFNYGSPQYRSRIFVSIAAPGHEPLPVPRHTHASPSNMMSRSIGITVNGQRYGSREFQKAPFPFASAASATSDLPAIGDGLVGICVRSPDHRLIRYPNWKSAGIISCIPRFPRGMGLARAMRNGSISPNAMRFLNRKSSLWKVAVTNKAYTRVHPGRLFSTIVTACSFDDAKDGKGLHWDEPRPLTIAEARRAQNIPDDEVIVGLPPQQWKQVGNGVAYGVSTTLGVALRLAWSATCDNENISHNLIRAEHCTELTNGASNIKGHHITDRIIIDLSQDASDENSGDEITLINGPNLHRRPSALPCTRPESTPDPEDELKLGDTPTALRFSSITPSDVSTLKSSTEAAELTQRKESSISTASSNWRIASGGSRASHSPTSSASDNCIVPSERTVSSGADGVDKDAKTLFLPAVRQNQHVLRGQPYVLVERKIEPESQGVAAVPIKPVYVASPASPKRLVFVPGLHLHTTSEDEYFDAHDQLT